MAEGHTADRPDLAQGIARADLSDGATLACDVDNEPVLLARPGEEIFAVGSVYANYDRPLVSGLAVGDRN